MRIFNAKKTTLTIPLSGSNQKLTISPRSVSGDFMPNKEFLSLIMTTFDYNEIALIVSGPFEISMCSQVSGSVGFVVYSLEEALERFPEDKPATTTAVNTAMLTPENTVKEPKPEVKKEESTDESEVLASEPVPVEEDSEEKADEPAEEEKTSDEVKVLHIPARKSRKKKSE